MQVKLKLLFTLTLILLSLSQKRGAGQSSTSMHNSADTEMECKFLMQQDQTFIHTHALFELMVTESKNLIFKIQTTMSLTLFKLHQIIQECCN